MIITNDFILINFPKTASSFTREVIKKVYERYSDKLFEEYFAPVIVDSKLAGQTSQHGTVQQIPSAHKSKRIISIIRNPFDRYVSLYTFGWWKDHPQTDFNILKNEFPTYPNISFYEFFKMTDRYGKKNALTASGIDYDVDIGLHSVQFIQYYSYDPASTFKRIITFGWRKEDLKVFFPDILFLHQEDLRNELLDFLQSLDLDKNDLQFIKTLDPINVSRDLNDKDFWKFYDDYLIDLILEKDRLIFDIFPNFRPKK